MPTSNQAFAQVLKRLRRELDMSQETLAFTSGVTVSTLSRIERGESSPTLNTVSRLAAALRMSTAELIAAAEESDSEPPLPEG